jgi:predicted small lipoprotein YifL
MLFAAVAIAGPIGLPDNNKAASNVKVPKQNPKQHISSTADDS